MSWKVYMFLMVPGHTCHRKPSRRLRRRLCGGDCFMSYAKSLFYAKATISCLCKKFNLCEGDCFMLFYVLCEKSVLCEGDCFMLYAKTLF